MKRLSSLLPIILIWHQMSTYYQVWYSIIWSLVSFTDAKTMASLNKSFAVFTSFSDIQSSKRKNLSFLNFDFSLQFWNMGLNFIFIIYINKHISDIFFFFHVRLVYTWKSEVRYKMTFSRIYKSFLKTVCRL